MRNKKTMIQKETAAKHGIKTIDTAEKIAVPKNEKLIALKNLAPELINSDGQLDVNALQDFVDIANTTSNNKGYELTFAGKGIARAKADTETKFELQFEPAQSKNAVIHNNPVGTNPRVCPDTENTVIRGDNLEVLKILKQNYFEKIKMIYIDPPYNTGNDGFIYNNNFKKNEEELIENFDLNEDTADFLQNIYGTKSHSGWLAFMYPRLKLARDLLKEDGVIFISIDDNEQANLKILCDEIFGEENFVGNICWNSTKSVTNTALLSVSHNNNFVYAKDVDYFIKNRKEFRLKESGNGFSNPDNDSRGVWKADPFQVGGWRPNQQYEIKNPNTSEIYKPNIGCSWKNDFKKFQELLKDNRIIFGKDGKSSPQRKRFLFEAKERGKVAKTWWDDVGTTTNGTQEVKNIFENVVFSNPKPVSLIKKMIELGDFNKDGLILDFFAGSGTTGDAVMQLNAEDGGNRKFILVQWDEAIKEKTEAHKFCTENNFKPVISSITIERLNRAGEKLLEKNNGQFDFSNGQKLDVGYKVFSLTEKPKLAEKNGLFTVENERQTTADKLYNMLCATGKPLHTAVKTLVDKKIFLTENAEGEEFLYVLGEIDPDILSGYDDAQIYIDGWADISLENWLNLFGCNEKAKERVGVVY